MTIVTESQWVNYYGFQRFPFDRPEAGNEEFARPEFLASCFVEPKSFERVFGQADSPATSLLFAARGTGKTACRVMMDYYCKSGLARLSKIGNGEQSFVLSVSHIHLDNVREIARQDSPNVRDPEIRVEHHAIEIMRQALPAFATLVANSRVFIEPIKRMPSDDIQDLGFIALGYSAYLTSTQAEFLNSLGVASPPISQPMKGFLGLGAKPKKQPTWEHPLFQQKMRASPLLHLEEWCKLIRKIGIFAMYVLVDGVDEIMESSGDSEFAYSTIRPLATHLRLMDSTSPLALKFFLPSNLEQFVIDDPAFRKDRGFVIKKIEWNEDGLIRILRERLNALRLSDYQFRDRTTVGFDALCIPDLRGDIEKNLVQRVDGNPRRLMNLCSLMVSAHCSREIQNQDDPYQLNRDDYHFALEWLDSKFYTQPSVKVSSPEKPVLSVFQGEREPVVFEEGQVIDNKYDVRKVLPAGGAGQVYCVYDAMFERMCALKVYNHSSISENFFKNEFRSLRRINHPHIVQVYDWGVLKESKRFYLVSEFVEGHDLKFYTEKENLLPVNKAVEVILELLSALEFIHPDVDRLLEIRNKMEKEEISEDEYGEYQRLQEDGWLHRDIKPANIILSAEGVKLIDFNISAPISSAGQTYTGTIGYMLPETGILRWSTDGDLFATGIVLNELITGNHPYPNQIPTVDSPPTDPREYMADLTPTFAEVILKAVSCDAGIRYHSAQSFHHDLLGLKGDFMTSTGTG